MTVTPVVAAITTLCASLALSGVIDGLRWWGYAGVAVTVVTAIGLGLRALRTPVLLVGLAQMFAILCLLVSLFTDSGVLGFLPGPASLGDLGNVLENSIEVVRTGVPPVPATQAVLCLVVIAIGLVSVLVDTLAVSAGTPAASGLVLLCVYAVPASLADEMLPWWAFVLGAASFAALLAVDGAHRHQLWRNRPTVQGTNGGFGGPAALVSGAVAIALLAGATVTVIGTVGQLPGGNNGSGSGGLGLNPFTSLRGMLDQEGNVELFRVRGMGDDRARYLRAITLPSYNKNGGWERETKEMPAGVPADEVLRSPGRQRPQSSELTNIQIEPVHSVDYWAAVAGTPVRLRGLPDDMRYDEDSGMVYGSESRSLSAYTEDADLSEPTSDDLRGDGSFSETGLVSDVYLRKDGISDDVTALAARLTANQFTTLDRVLAIQRYFDTANGFRYDTQTAVGTDESGLEDFLFKSKTGFCEQFASAMGILLRAAGIPSRVAMGYTAGYQNGEYRTITTQNAHAWVEVFFPSSGWVTFDPTPLSDGTSYDPPYATGSGPSGPEDDPNDPSATSTAPSTPNAPTSTARSDDPTQQAGANGATQEESSKSWLWITAGAIVLVAILLTAGTAASGSRPRRRARLLPFAVAAWGLVAVAVAGVVSWWLALLVVLLIFSATPGVIRERRRLSHRNDVHRGGPAAASSAWSELLAESRDRGIEVGSTETVRTAARRIAREHSLDDGGKRALRTVVSEVERSWYGDSETPDPTLAPAYDDLMDGIRRNAPLGLRGKILPKSVLRR
ncbi:transglutaminase superfamily protein [Actinophytocola oryzae]|uniref:Transglutaminase superfamily protein n=2 Tax=Actinophytocola oryzae TaxID=502181 RepID=A0A4R7VBB0_9PSEU|nr:transglutaminase superfamily protein [Actinophytocola oryzae]